MNNWKVFRGEGDPHDDVIERLPAPPPWRDFVRRRESDSRGSTFQPEGSEIEVVNAALYLRRPLLITGAPGSGKSSLIYRVAEELKLGRVLKWPISSRSNLQEGLYQYDALMRLRDVNRESVKRKRASPGVKKVAKVANRTAAKTEQNQPAAADSDSIGDYIRLGPLGTAMFGGSDRPRALLIDEIDKSDIDLPNDLLHVFEEGEFEIPELVRIRKDSPKVKVFSADEDARPCEIEDGRVRCQQFPFVVLTSNGERALPPAFLRRCLRLDVGVPDKARLLKIVQAHLDPVTQHEVEDLIQQFDDEREKGKLLATDQLLNAVFLLTRDRTPTVEERKRILEVLLRELGSR